MRSRVGAVATDDGEVIRYSVRGAGSTTLVLMHGWAGSGRYFDPLIDHLDLSALRAISPDLRGHGRSSSATRGFNDDRLACDVLQVADREGADRFAVLGFSMSGRFAQQLSVLAPDRVVARILVAGCPAAALPFPSSLRDDWVSRAGDAERLREITESYTSRPVDEPVLRVIAEDAARATAEALAGTLDTVIASSCPEAVYHVQTPTLVVAGTDDPMFTSEMLREQVVDRLPVARLAIVDSNHEIPIEQPAALARLVEGFLSEQG